MHLALPLPISRWIVKTYVVRSWNLPAESVSNEWDVLQDIVADLWDLAEKEESENTSSSTEATKGHATISIISPQPSLIVYTL